MFQSWIRRPRLPLALLLALACAVTVSAGLPNVNKASKGLLNKATGAPTGGAAEDPKAWLGRADDVVSQLKGATDCLEKGRSALFSLAATSEEKRLLQSMQDETVAAKGDVVAKTRQYQAEVVEKAKKEKRYEAKRLSTQQTVNLGKIGSNLLLAMARDRQALDSGHKLIENADDVMKAAKEPKNMAKLGGDTARLASMPVRLGQALGDVPGQLTALQALLEAVEQTRKNNPVELKPAPAAGGAFETVEDF